MNVTEHASRRLLTLAARTLSPAGQRARLTILIYHRVLPQPDSLQPGCPDRDALDLQLHWIRSCFQVVPLIQAINDLASGNLPERALCITFDDGYADNFTQALPILKRHKIPATVFVATDYLNGGRMFNDTVIEILRRSTAGEYDLSDIDLGTLNLTDTASRIAAIDRILSKVKYLPYTEREQQVARLAARLNVDLQSLPSDLMLSTAQLQKLHQAGIDIGAHTASHPILATLTDQDAEADIARSKAQLEALLDTEVKLFAYPNGKPGTDYTTRDSALVKKLGFSGAVSTAWGAAHRQTDIYQLPRFSPWGRTPIRFQLQLLRNLLQRK